MTLSSRIKNDKFVVWQTPTSGDKMAPFDDPELHLDRVWFSSTFDYYRVAAQASVSLTHQSVAGLNTTLGALTISGQVQVQDQLLFTHNLGYAPRYKIVVGGKLIQSYYPVQTAANQVRTVSFYATATELRCLNFGVSSSIALASTTVTYGVLIFKNRDDGVDPGLPVFSASQGIMARGLIKASDKVLRRSDNADASPFDLLLGPGVDIANGSAKQFIPGGGSVAFPTSSYNGSATAPASIQCAVE